MTSVPGRLTAALLVLLQLLLLNACAGPTQFSLPGNHFHLPETLPAGQYRIAVENAGITEVQMFKGNITAPPDYANPELAASNGQTGLHGARGMSPKLELQLQTLPYLSDNGSGAPGLTAKYRLGDPRNDDSPAINSAMIGGLALWKKETHTNGSPTYYNDLNVMVLELGGVTAWRFSPHWQLYGGPWLTMVFYDGDSHRRSGSITDQRASHGGTATQLGINAGLAWHLNVEWSILGEVAVNRIGWQDASTVAIHSGVQLRKMLR